MATDHSESATDNKSPIENGMQLPVDNGLPNADNGVTNADNGLLNADNSPVSAVEEVIIPSSKVQGVNALPEWLADDSENSNSVETEPAAIAQPDLSPRTVEVDVESADVIGDASEPVMEPLIEPTCQHKAEKMLADMREKSSLDDTITVKPITLTVDTVKVKDAEIVGSQNFTSNLEQPSPNDSGIHCERALSEPEDLTVLLETSDDSSSSRFDITRRLSKSTDDIASANPSESEHNKDEEEVLCSSSISSSQLSPR